MRDVVLVAVTTAVALMVQRSLEWSFTIGSRSARARRAVERDAALYAALPAEVQAGAAGQALLARIEAGAADVVRASNPLARPPIWVRVMDLIAGGAAICGAAALVLSHNASKPGITGTEAVALSMIMLAILWMAAYAVYNASRPI